MSDMQRCPQCGATLPADSAGGRCPKCLLKMALETSTDPLLETGSGVSASADAGAASQDDSYGPYVQVQVLGEGGMGTVYLARQQHPIRRQVALKVVKRGVDSRQVLERFEIERQALALMDHPNIARVLDAGTSERGRPYFVMEYVEGVAVTQYCDRKALSTRERLQLFVPICSALQHAHKKGIIHRDVKPSNVLVTEMDGKPVPKVIDFGVARAIEQRSAEYEAFTLSGQLVGTPEYMSPEQASLDNRDIDTGTDVYSLGVVLYELLVGVLPLDIKSLRKIALGEVLRAIREIPVPKPTARITEMGAAAQGVAQQRSTNPGQLKKELSGDLDSIVMKAIDKDRYCRYASASEFAADIERYLRDEPVLASPPDRRYRVRKFILRHRLYVAAAVSILFCLLLGLAASTAMYFRAESARRESQRQSDIARQQSYRAESASREAQHQRDLATQAATNAIASREEAQAQGKVALARALVARSDLIFADDERGLETAALLASESLLLPMTFDADRALRQALNLLPRTRLVMVHPGYVNSIAFSPDGKWLATASDDGTARVMEATTGKEVSRLTHGGPVSAVAFSPDGKWLATASDDGTARVMEAATGKEVSRLTHGGPVYAVAFSPDGKWVATGGEDGIVQVIKASTGKEVSRLAHVGRVWALAFSSDGKWVATASEDTTARVMEAATGKEVSRLTHGGPVYAVAFSLDGTWLATASHDGTARVIETSTEKEVSRLTHGGPVYAVAFSSDGKRVATGSEDGTARVMEAATGREVSRVALPGIVRMVTFSPDGTWLATGSLSGVGRVLDVGTGKEVFRDYHGGGSVNAVAFSPDGKLLATAAMDKTVRVMEARFGTEVSRFTHQDSVYAVAFSPDGKQVATGSPGGGRVFDAATGKEVLSFAQRSSVEAVAFSSDGKQVATGSPGGGRVFDAATGKEVLSFDQGSPVLAVAFSQDGRRVVTGSQDGTVQVRDAATGRKVSHFAQGGPVRAVAFSPDGKWVATGSEEACPEPPSIACGTARVLEVATGREVSPHAPGNSIPNAVAFSPNGKWLATGYDRHIASVWDAKGGFVLEHPSPSQVLAVAFSSDGAWMASGSDVGTVRVMEAATGKELHRLELRGAVRQLRFSPDRQWLQAVHNVSTGNDLIYARLPLTPEELRREVCEKVMRNLTVYEWKQYVGPETPYRHTCPQLTMPLVGKPATLPWVFVPAGSPQNGSH